MGGYGLSEPWLHPEDARTAPITKPTPNTIKK